MFPFNKLPVELQREIFVVAAISERGSALRLVRVARRIRLWVQSYIYDLVTLGSDDTKLFLRTMDSVPPEFFANYVKRLCLSVSVSARNAERILKVCTVGRTISFAATAPKTLYRAQPLRLLFSDPKAPPKWCNSVTHLDIILWKHQSSPTIPHLHKLLSLTHLALRPRHNLEDHYLLPILSSCKRLRILIIFDDPDSEETVWAEDPRVVYMPYPFKIIPEWEAQAKQDDDCSWSRAEELDQLRYNANL
ncbi:hypothetical protein BJ912DRAFT_1021995 [Pholiota molesta]|nr:hypothetical protein BJ912DRAFT_1021995 [Pholiota molesta]